MSFLTAELAQVIIEYAIKYGPKAGQALVKIFTKPQVSAAELSEAFEIAELSYDEIVHPNQVAKTDCPAYPASPSS